MAVQSAELQVALISPWRHSIRLEASRMSLARLSNASNSTGWAFGFSWLSCHGGLRVSEPEDLADQWAQPSGIMKHTWSQAGISSQSMSKLPTQRATRAAVIREGGYTCCHGSLPSTMAVTWGTSPATWWEKQICRGIWDVLVSA